MKASKSYQESLLAALRDPEEAAEYLNAALEDGDEQIFLLALRNVAEANGLSLGFGESASSLSMHKSLNTLLNDLHLRFAIASK
jgi:DNA-binding phage protein